MNYKERKILLSCQKLYLYPEGYGEQAKKYYCKAEEKPLPNGHHE